MCDRSGHNSAGERAPLDIPKSHNMISALPRPSCSHEETRHFESRYFDYHHRFGDAGRKALHDMAPKYGITIVADERYGPKDSDMTTQLTKVKAAGAQAVINWSVGPGQVVVTKNWYALKMGVSTLPEPWWAARRISSLQERLRKALSRHSAGWWSGTSSQINSRRSLY